MKKISTVLFSICMSFAFGQKVSDYKYISVPEKFESFKRDYGLKDFFIKSLNTKKYEIISGNNTAAFSEINPCNIVYANVQDDSSWLVNKVIVQFKDCNGQTILETKGRTDIKEYVEGYQDALKQAILTLPTSSPTSNNTMVISTKAVAETEALPSTSLPSNTNTSSKYTNGKVNLQKIQLDNSQFILADPNSSVPYATFTNSSKKDVFRVKLANGKTTLGYLENGNIVIEIPKQNDEYLIEVFITK